MTAESLPPITEPSSEGAKLHIVREDLPVELSRRVMPQLLESEWGPARRRTDNHETDVPEDN